MELESKYYLSLKKIKNMNKLRSALLHNLRLINSKSSIDKSLSTLNYEIGQSYDTDEIFDRLRLYKKKFQIRFRKNQIICVEILISMPKLQKKPDFHEQNYFHACKEFIEAEFKCPILSATVHLDESHPHTHIIIFPISEGKMAGAKILGGPADFNKRRQKFKDNVLSRFFYTEIASLNSNALAKQMLENIQSGCIKNEMLMKLVTYFINKHPRVCARLLESWPK